MLTSPIYLTTKDVAAILVYKHTDTVVRLIQSGKLPCDRRVVKAGRVRYLVSADELRQYLETYEPKSLPAFFQWCEPNRPIQPQALR